MQNITKTISSFLKTKISNLKTYNDLFPTEDAEGVVLIHDPSARKLNEFIDGSSEFQLNIGFKARFKDASKCRNVLDAVLNNLENQKLLDSTDSLKLQVRTVSNVSFLGIDEKNYSIYSASITVEYRTTTF